MTSHPLPADADRPVSRTGPLLAALVLATAVVTIDNTVLNVALPSISRTLGAGTSELQWIVNAYSLLFGGLLLTAGTLADRIGHRRVLLAGLVAFGVGSAAVVAVRTPAELIALRAVIGATAAFVMPSTLATLMRSFSGRARANAVGLWGAVSAAGFAVGPVLGGTVLHWFPWQGVFLINVPIVVVAFVVCRRVVPTHPGRRTGRADLPGALLSVATMVCLVDALVSGPDHGWTSRGVLAAAAATVVLGAGFVARELRAASPMVDLRRIAHRRFAGPAIAEGALMFSIAGTLFLITQHLQLVLGHSALVAGLLVAPASLGVLVASPLLAKYGQNLTARRSAAFGLLIAAIAVAAIALGTRSGYWPLAVGLTVFGVGLRLALTPVALAVVDALPAEDAGMGSALNDTFQEVGTALGVAVLGCVFNLGYRNALPAGAPAPARSSLGAALALHDGAVAAAARTAFDTGMQDAFWVCAAILGVVALISLRTLPATVLHEDEIEPELVSAARRAD